MGSTAGAALAVDDADRPGDPGMQAAVVARNTVGVALPADDAGSPAELGWQLAAGSTPGALGDVADTVPGPEMPVAEVAEAEAEAPSVKSLHESHNHGGEMGLFRGDHVEQSEHVRQCSPGTGENVLILDRRVGELTLQLEEMRRLQATVFCIGSWSKT